MPVVLPREISELAPPTRGLVEPLLRETRRHYGSCLVAVAVFGSLARGTAGPESDIDILVVAQDLPKGRLPRVEQFLPVEERLAARYAQLRSMRLSPIFKSPEEVKRGSPLFWDMTEDVIVLFDREDFLRLHLDDVKRRLRELRARRVFKDNAWYWILKGDFRPGEVFEL